MDDTQQGQSKAVYDFPVEREALQSKSKDEVINAYCSTREELEEVKYQLDASTTEQQQLRIELENTSKEVNQLQQTVADLIAKITPDVSQGTIHLMIIVIVMRMMQTPLFPSLLT